MATISTIADDFDGSTPAKTVTFYADGKSYQIDLNADHESELQDVIDAYHKALAPYLDKARAVSNSNSSKRNQSGPSPKDVRLWAVENGYNVSERGRIPSEVMDAYRDRSKK